MHKTEGDFLKKTFVIFAALSLSLLTAGCKEKNTKRTPAEPTVTGSAVTPVESVSTPTATPVRPVESSPPIPETNSHSIQCLVNRDYPLSEDFVPENLTVPDIMFPFSDTTIDKAKLTKEAAAALDALFDAAYEEENLVLYGVSGYRSYSRQYTIYATNLATGGIEQTNAVSAAPGRSEHQTGLAMDISCRSENFSLETTFADTPEGKWVAENAARFGFILRYPKGKEAITGYAYEPWHLRYVGLSLAKTLFESGMTMEEYYQVPCSMTEEYLATTPLIDTTAQSYLDIYNQYH